MKLTNIFSVPIRSNIMLKLYMVHDNDPFLLYPYDMVKYVMIVPNIQGYKIKTMGALLKSPLITVWAISILLFSLMRLLIRKIKKQIQNCNSLVYIVFNTFGLLFATTSVTDVNERSERMLTVFISFYSLLSSIGCSSFLFTQLTFGFDFPLINTVADLLQYEQINIMVPMELETAILGDEEL